jgi:hypothetical protein
MRNQVRSVKINGSMPNRCLIQVVGDTMHCGWYVRSSNVNESELMLHNPLQTTLTPVRHCSIIATSSEEADFCFSSQVRKLSLFRYSLEGPHVRLCHDSMYDSDTQ